LKKSGNRLTQSGQRGQYFAGNYPASTVVGVTGLAFEGALLEVEAIAVLK